MSEYKISLVLSAIRTKIWPKFIEACKINTIPIEIIFVGDVKPDFELPSHAKFIYATVKPAQCYEIGFRHATGELVAWTADDARYDHNNQANLDNAYNSWKALNNEKGVIAMRPIEDHFDVFKNHHFFGKQQHTPYMAPFGVLSNKFYKELGGYDRRFICGQAENDIIMRVYEAGGVVELDMNAYVYVDHLGAHPLATHDFRVWYPKDRIILEDAWVEQGYGAFNEGRKYTMSTKRLLPLEPFVDENITTVTQGPVGKW